MPGSNNNYSGKHKLLKGILLLRVAYPAEEQHWIVETSSTSPSLCLGIRTLLISCPNEASDKADRFYNAFEHLVLVLYEYFAFNTTVIVFSLNLNKPQTLFVPATLIADRAGRTNKQILCLIWTRNEDKLDGSIELFFDKARGVAWISAKSSLKHWYTKKPLIFTLGNCKNCVHNLNWLHFNRPDLHKFRSLIDQNSILITGHWFKSKQK